LKLKKEKENQLNIENNLSGIRKKKKKLKHFQAFSEFEKFQVQPI